jgi:hypothetical protein
MYPVTAPVASIQVVPTLIYSVESVVSYHNIPDSVTVGGVELSAVVATTPVPPVVCNFQAEPFQNQVLPPLVYSWPTAGNAGNGNDEDGIIVDIYSN